jgi:hypothetical protein
MDQQGTRSISLRNLLAELARDDEEIFRRRYPHPFLLVLMVRKDTPVHSGPMGVTRPGLPEPDDQPAALADAPLIQRGQVVLLAKSDRNAQDSTITVGRASNNDIIIPSATVSKFHCIFERSRSGEYRLTDLGSANGTQLNRVSLARNRPEPVRSGDIVRIHNIDFEFLETDALLDILRSMG